MSDTVIKIENLSKTYHLGQIGTGTLSHDLNRWWKMNIMGKEDPYTIIGNLNDRTAKAEKGEMVAALHDINLEVRQGEVLGIIGKNGAGKSTLLKILSRVTSPTTGSIKVKGRMASLLEVGTGFHPEMTGLENIYMNGTIMGMRKWEIDKKLDEIVEFAGVAKYLDTPVKRYSSGMTVRLGFAIAAHLEPEILIVDEVLAVGDAEFQKKAIGKMQDVSTNDGRTVLFVSHNLPIISSLCNKAILLINGSISSSGTTNNVIDEYIKQTKRKENGFLHTKDESIEFLGIINKQKLNHLNISDNIEFIFRFKTSRYLENVFIDIGIHNQQEQMIIHTKAKFISVGINLEANKIIDLRYMIYNPRLAPGAYFMTIYLYNKDKVLFWCDNITACIINSTNTFKENNTLIIDEIKGIIVPLFSIEKLDNYENN